MPTVLQAADMAHVIQLSVAPVFLLTGIGALLSVLSARVGRIVDRSRLLEDLLEQGMENAAVARRELEILGRRAHVANWAIGLCTTCALFVCTLIVTLFAGAFLNWNVAVAVSLLFVAAMAALILGLLCFLKEIHLAIANLRVRCEASAARCGQASPK